MHRFRTHEVAFKYSRMMHRFRTHVALGSHIGCRKRTNFQNTKRDEIPNSSVSYCLLVVFGRSGGWGGGRGGGPESAPKIIQVDWAKFHSLWSSEPSGYPHVGFPDFKYFEFVSDTSFCCPARRAPKHVEDCHVQLPWAMAVAMAMDMGHGVWAMAMGHGPWPWP